MPKERKVRPLGRWDLVRLVNYDWCDDCKRTIEPIFEMTKKQSGSSLWRYLCQDCCQKRGAATADVLEAASRIKLDRLPVGDPE